MSMLYYLRYVGAIWFAFHVLKLLPITRTYTTNFVLHQKFYNERSIKTGLKIIRLILLWSTELHVC